MHYKQVKIYLPPELAASFKSLCREENESVTSALSRFMAERCAAAIKKKTDPEPFSTRAKRRNSVKRIASQLNEIRDAEEQAQENFPKNLRGSSIFESYGEILSRLDEAIEMLDEVY